MSTDRIWGTFFNAPEQGPPSDIIGDIQGWIERFKAIAPAELAKPIPATLTIFDVPIQVLILSAHPTSFRGDEYLVKVRHADHGFEFEVTLTKEQMGLDSLVEVLSCPVQDSEPFIGLEKYVKHKLREGGIY